MAIEIKMPALSPTMTTGTLAKWLVGEGEQVNSGDVIAEIETDKATVEYEAYTGGVMAKIVAEEGVAIQVGELIAVITNPDEAIPDDILEGTATVTANTVSDDLEQSITAEAAPAQASVNLGFVKASPLAKRIARERGVDLTLITGTGPGGRIVESDVLAYDSDASVATAVEQGEVRASPLARRLAKDRGIDLSSITGTGPG